jgi:hypothetical protein
MNQAHIKSYTHRSGNFKFILTLILLSIAGVFHGCNHEENSNATYLVLLDEGNAFMKILEQDINSGAQFLKVVPKLANGQCFIALKLPDPDANNSGAAEQKYTTILYYEQEFQPSYLLRAVVNSDNSSDPGQQKAVIQHLVGFTVLRHPTDESPVLEIMVTLGEKRGDIVELGIPIRKAFAVVL